VNPWYLLIPFGFFAAIWFGLETEHRPSWRFRAMRIAAWYARTTRRVYTGCVITPKDARWLQKHDWHDCPDCSKPLAKHR
jgi:hypothetical protein